MKLIKQIASLFYALILSSCAASNSSESNSIPEQTQTPNFTIEDIKKLSFSRDKEQLEALIPECINALNLQPVSVSTIERFGYKKSAINLGTEVYQNITSRNFVGLTANFDQFAYKSGHNCALLIGMSLKDRYFAFQKNAFSTLENNGFMRVETKGIVGNTIIKYHSSDGKLVANVTLQRNDPSHGVLTISKL